MCLLYMGCLIVVGNALSPSKHFIIPFRKTQTQTLLELKSFSSSLNSRRKANYHSSRNRIRTRLSLSSSTLEGNKSVGENYNNNNDKNNDNNNVKEVYNKQEKIIKNVVTEKVAKQVSTLNACVGYKQLQPQDWFINQGLLESYSYIHAYSYIHIYIRLYMHTYIHTYMHMLIRICSYIHILIHT